MGTIRGGMEFFAGKPIVVAPPPLTLDAHPLVLTLPRPPCVSLGQSVRVGDLLLEADGPTSVRYISTVTGTVSRIDTRAGGHASTVPPNPQGPGGSAKPPKSQTGQMGCDTPGRVMVGLEPDGAMVDTILDLAPPAARNFDDWHEAIRSSGPWPGHDGIVGLNRQLEAVPRHKPDKVICVGLDDFPPFPDRSSLLMSFTEQVVRGTLLLAEIVRARDVTLLAANNREVLKDLRGRCRKLKLKLITAEDVYPRADPTLVAWAFGSRRRLAWGHNPVEQGIVMISPWTAIRIAHWVDDRRLCMAAPVMIASTTRNWPLSVVYAMPGQPISTLSMTVADALSLNQLVIRGHPMTGMRAVPDVDEQGRRVPAVFEGYESLMTVFWDAPALRQPDACVSCGWCVDICPTGLQPIYLYDLIQKRPAAGRLGSDLPWCIDCGLCTYACPSSIPLAQTIRHAATDLGLR